jgi:hypothetical protein
MRSKTVCDYCKQETKSFFGLLDVMICSECYVVLDLYLLKMLKQIALDRDMTLNALLIEGVNLVIQKYEGKFKK